MSRVVSVEIAARKAGVGVLRSMQCVLAIDRQEGELEGELLDFNDDLIGTMQMNCEKVDPDELPEPKL